MKEDEKVIWLDEGSPHDELAMAIYTELNLQRYKEYLPYALSLLRLQTLRKTVNGIELNFELSGNRVEITYRLPDGQEFKKVEKLDLRPLLIENQVDQQLLLLITEAETNALLYEAGKEFQFYIQPAVGYSQPQTGTSKLRQKLDQLRYKLRNKIK